jgi:RNA polymerase sigma-70 factor (ECF subfamily)
MPALDVASAACLAPRIAAHGNLRLVRPLPEGTAEGTAMSGAPAPGAQEDLVRRIVAGDARAESELVERFGDGLLFLLRRWTRDAATAEDLYQETLRLALEKIRGGEVREPDKLVGFLRSLAKNLSIHHYRRGAVRGERERDLEEVGAGETIAQAPSDQLTRLLRAEKATLVRQVIAEMPMERDRQVLFRFYIGEEERERICADLALTGPELNVVLFRARQRYRRLFEERFGVPGD